ncbi:hypothetical protein IWQ57_001615 [Coemansia nantahalensis]|uniref:Uncharacterized protein n=1 Tax=Coemansia nantahalensis TaxID=2789366 RepID=A0ACC1K3W9_9FUNG|nr:hypothetical protein IWQ57_001615 [Coemansia nantahalensis]
MAAEAGGVGLVHSLLRSRLAWLTDAFAALDAECAELPRHALGAAELQIGPHLFAGTTFYRVGAAPAAEAPARCSQAQLAFEFGDNSGSLFWLPPDLGIEDPPGGDGHPVRAFFFATPRLPLADRRPRAIRREQPHYYIAQRTLVRVGIAMRGVERALAEALRDYARQPHATVWRDYRQAVCQSRPTAKYWFQFFPGQHQQALLKTVRLPPAGPGAKAPRARPERPAAQQTPTARPAPPPRTPPAPVVSGGGKGGYNVSVAAALLRKRRRLGQAPDVDSDADSDSGNSDSAPPDSPGADAASPARGRSCSACGCGETPIWRRGPAGAGTLCNACGVKWKLGKLQR